jgi:predicted dehydrogenase
MGRSRREFLRTVGASGAAYWLTANAASAIRVADSPNGKLAIACIGVGGRGADNVQGVKGETLVGLCDVDEKQAGKTFEQFPTVERFVDFRVMLDKIKPLDAVVVATPDHTHAVAGMAAMRLGKHLYCEKPLAHSLAEVRAMRDMAAKMKLATQMGIQIHAEQNYRRSVELMRSGILGDIRQAYGWSAANYHAEERPKTEPVPQGLNWDLWIGPAPEQAYSSAYVPFSWRRFRDFGTGGLGDMACHILDSVFAGLELRAPTRVQTIAAQPNPVGFPGEIEVQYDFPARSSAPPVKLTWWTGSKRPPAELGDGEKWSGGGFLVVGSRGRLLCNHMGDHKLLPTAQFTNAAPPSTLPKHPGHHREWINACKTGSSTGANFEYAAGLTEAVLLGNVAHLAKQPIEWDSANLRVTNVPAANEFLRRDYRKGWTL